MGKDRIRSWVITGAGYVGAGMIACSPAGPVERQPTVSPIPFRPTSTPELVIPTMTPFSTSTPVRIEPTATRAPILVATNTPVIAEPTPSRIILNPNDPINEMRIRQAKVEEILTLDDALIGNIFRFYPWLDFGEFYFATLKTVNQVGESKTRAWLLSSDCIFDVLRERGELGNNLIGGRLEGAWKPEKRLNQLRIHVLAPASVNIPTSVLNVDQVSFMGISRGCDVETAVEFAADIIGRINPEEIPQNADDLAEFVARTGRAIYDGVRRGIRNP